MLIKFNQHLNFYDSKKNIIKFIRSKKNFHGPGENFKQIESFLKKKFNFKNSFLTNSCTSALEVAALSFELNKNDEVLLPSYSFITTGSSFSRTGAKLIYCDISTNNLMPSFEDIKKKVTTRTKVIIITHYQGFSVSYLDKLKIFCKKKSIYLVEDSAQGFGSKHKDKYLGTYGDVSCFSFHYTKNLHCGAGGLIVINNKKLLKKIRYIYDKGTNRIDQINNKIKYYSWVSQGSFFMLTELQAAYLFPQIKNHKKIFVFRKKIYQMYKKNINQNQNYKLILNNQKYYYNYHSIILYCKNKNADKLISFLKMKNIEAYIGYYPLHLSKFGKKYKTEKLINTENAFKSIVRLPLNNNLSLKNIKYVIDTINQFIN